MSRGRKETHHLKPKKPTPAMTAANLLESYFWIGVSALTLRVTPFLVFFAVLAETFVQANVRFVSDRK